MDHWTSLLAYSAYPVIHAATAPRIRFYLHKEFRDGEIRLYLHKEFRAAEIRFPLHKEWGRCVRKWRFSNKETAFAGSIFFQELSFYDRTVARGLAMLSCLFRSKLICSLAMHKVFLHKFSHRIFFKSQDRDAFADSPFNR